MLALLPGPGGQDPQPVITVAGQSFATWHDYVSSALFRTQGLRCGTAAPDLPGAALSLSDCSLAATLIRGRYAPAGHSLYRIPVVVHVLQSTGGEGQISDALVQSQIAVLNEDFRALTGTPGENGTDTRVEFYLATLDPDGNPTTGITRTTNDQWFDDSGPYYDALAWNTHRYLNIYTNRASGALGYVPNLPQAGGVGSDTDRVVILWSAFGRGAPIGPPFDMGRTATHEVGHYLGLFHTFDYGCGLATDCYTTGDRICDTNPESVPVTGCPESASSCGFDAPFHNYMDYSDDACYEEFTLEQANRVRCTIEKWRAELPECIPAASITVRNAGANVPGYTATPPVMGSTMSLNVVAPTHTTAVILGYSAPANRPLLRGLVLLVDNLSGANFELVLPLPSSGVIMPVPNKAALCGRTSYTQAILIGGAPFGLTNAIDMTIGR
jgi:hypothetical protein